MSLQFIKSFVEYMWYVVHPTSVPTICRKRNFGIIHLLFLPHQMTLRISVTQSPIALTFASGLGNFVVYWSSAGVGGDT